MPPRSTTTRLQPTDTLKRPLLALAALAVLAPGALAVAQDDTSAIAPTEAVEADAPAEPRAGSGLGSGNLSFHPGLRLEAGFDSNVFFDDEQEKITTSPTLGVVPSIGLVTRRATNVDLQLDAELLYLQYFSDDQKVADQSGFTFDAKGQVTFNPNGAVALKISDSFTRSNEPPNGAGFESYNRISNTLAGAVVIQPGGKVLTAEVGGAFTLFRHTYLTDLDRQTIGLDAKLKWKFLPKTAVMLQFDWDFNSYKVKDRTIPFHDDDSLPSFLEPFLNDTGIKNVNSQPLRIQGGVAGLLGRRFSVVLLGGWGKGFYDSGEDFSSVIGRVEGAYEIGPTSRLRLGYMRDFSDSSFANFFAFHKVYGRYNQQFGSRFEMGLEGAFQLQQFSLNPGPVLDQVSVDGVLGANAFSTDRREDPVVLVKADGTLFLGDIFHVGARYELDINTSDFVMITGIVSPDGARDPNDINTQGTATSQFVKHRIFLTTGVRW